MRTLTEFSPHINTMLAGFTCFALVFWMVRREETVFAWLTLIGTLWVAHNITAIAATASQSFAPAWIPLQLLPGTFVGFYLSYSRLPLNRLLPAASLVAGAFAGLLPYVIPDTTTARLLAQLIFVANALTALVWLLRVPQHSPGVESLTILAVSVFGVAGGLHDMLRDYPAWPLLGHDIAPFAGTICFVVLAFLLGRRVLHALLVEENLNVLLENRVRAANATLNASEAARRALEVSGAISTERDRLMREIHDGIGSSLVTALAIAERKGAEVDGPQLLKRALTDLRIAVDSLEPVQGDLATLMASLRYRVEPDLKKAGITFDWKVEIVAELDWLDAVNALHVLRIFQEAMSNVLGHAQATIISVSCRAEGRDGRKGVRIEVSDNGLGFIKDGSPRGHGLKNMKSRAEALAGVLTYSSELGHGTKVALWLPVSKLDE